MTVRQFDGVDDEVIRTIGALESMTHGVVAFLTKAPATNTRVVMALHTSANGGRLEIDFESDTDVAYWSGNATRFVGQNDDATDWRLWVIRKTSGTVQPRCSRYSFTAASWTHVNASITTGDAGAPGAGGYVRNSYQGGSPFDGKIAAMAMWSNAVGTWTLDASGDAAIEAAGLETALYNWLDANPDAAWVYNQDAVTDPVDDLTSGGANQVSRVGTTVVTDDDPPGFDFSLTSGAVVAATGGTVTDAGGWRYHTFTADGDLVVTSGGEVEYLIVAGGGGGGGYETSEGGGTGAGAGGVLTGTMTLSNQTYGIVIGAGGAYHVNGSDSSLASSSATGGGHGGTDRAWNSIVIEPGDGGSGGGAVTAAEDGTTFPAGTGVVGQGHDGGPGNAKTGGGGGGASEAGQLADTDQDTAGDGGDGIEWPVSSGDYYGGGGGGGAGIGGESSWRGDGGLGGGGRGTSGSMDAEAGVANTGGGGGGSRSGLPGVGGSGIVIVRYSLAAEDPTNFSVTISGTTATLSWDPPTLSGATHVDIFRRTGSETTAFDPVVATAVQRLAVGTTTWDDVGLSDGSYVWQVYPVKVS